MKYKRKFEIGDTAIINSGNHKGTEVVITGAKHLKTSCIRQRLFYDVCRRSDNTYTGAYPSYMLTPTDDKIENKQSFMKQQVIFKGVVDKHEFDNYDDFKKYLDSHQDAKNVSFSREIKYVNDEQKPESTNKELKQPTSALELPSFCLDEYLNEGNSLESAIEHYKKTCKDFVDEFVGRHDSWNEDQGQQMYHRLFNWNKKTIEQDRLNEQALDQVCDRLGYYRDKLRCVENEAKKLNEVISKDSDRAKYLKTVRELLKIENETYEFLVKNDIENDKEAEETNPLLKLLSYLF